MVGGTINLVKNTHFYGRYWGGFKFVQFLHFEACYYKAIEYCIEHGITYMEPGAGDFVYLFIYMDVSMKCLYIHLFLYVYLFIYMDV